LINLNEILKSNLNNEKLKNIDLQNKIDKQINIIHNNDSKINDLYAKIEDLKEKLSRYPFELKKDEKMISVIFTSDDQKIHFSVICKNTEKFNRLEEKLYNDYPEYSETNNYFVVNGNRIQKFKTLDENNIRNSDIIILNQINI
jgi:seryl-tRNA synthetase